MSKVGPDLVNKETGVSGLVKWSNGSKFRIKLVQEKGASRDHSKPGSFVQFLHRGGSSAV